MYCEKCGFKLNDSSIFCEKCGNRVSGAQKQSSFTAAPHTEWENEPQTNLIKKPLSREKFIAKGNKAFHSRVDAIIALSVIMIGLLLIILIKSTDRMFALSDHISDYNINKDFREWYLLWFSTWTALEIASLISMSCTVFGILKKRFGYFVFPASTAVITILVMIANWEDSAIFNILFFITITILITSIILIILTITIEYEYKKYLRWHYAQNQNNSPNYPVR